MTAKTAAQTITRLIAEHLGVAEDTVKPESTLDHDLGADSLDCIEITMGIEDEFAVSLADDDCANCRTVADWTALVERSVTT